MPEELPKTIALIPDGNRRWAKMHRFSVFNAYKWGVSKFIDFSEWCVDYGINSITVWAFSTENASRDNKEIGALFRIYKSTADDGKLLARLKATETSIRIVGNTSLLPKDLLASLKNLERHTRKHSKRVINILIGYGGKDDILHAAKELVKEIRDKPMRVTEQLFKTYLVSNAIPDIDLIIRTSGEHRLSGFIPWQSNYSELYFSKKLWPDFNKRDLKKALVDYSRRQRRFGR